MKRLLCLLFAVSIFLFGCSKEEADPNMVASAGDFSIYIAESGSYNIHYKSKITDIFFPQTKDHLPSLESVDCNADGVEEALLIDYQPISPIAYAQKISILEADANDNVKKQDCSLSVKNLYKKVQFVKQDANTVLVKIGNTTEYLYVSDKNVYKSGEIDEKITYKVEEGRIIASARVGLFFEGRATSYKYGYIDAYVKYKNNKFSFTNITYRKF